MSDSYLPQPDNTTKLGSVGPEIEEVVIRPRFPGAELGEFRLAGPAGDHQLNQIRRASTFHENDLLTALALQNRDHDVVIDVGASIGNHTVFFATVLGADVVSIEPSPAALPFLRHNIEANGIADRIEVWEVAGANRSGYAYIGHPDPGNVGLTQLLPHRTGTCDVRVRCKPLDQIVRESALTRGRRVSLVKIDVEGNELDVIRGSRRLIRDCAPVIVVELASDEAFRSVADHLVDFGYSVSGPFCSTQTFVFVKRADGDNAPLLRELRRELIVLREQVQTLAHSFEPERPEEKARKAAPATASRIDEASLKYRLGHAIASAVRPSRETLRLPGRLWSIYRDYTSRRPELAVVESQSRDDRENVERRQRQFDTDFERFVGQLKDTRPRHFVVMYGGTTYIQDLRANRPIRLTNRLLDLGVPVLFNFHRWRDTDHIPDYERADLFQSPIDQTPRLACRLFGEDLSSSQSLFVVSYPHPSVVRLINQANANGWATIYDCRDDWQEFEKVGAAKWYDEAVERFVVSNCDLSCCVSRVLQTKLQGFAPSADVRRSPNAYDPGFLSKGYERQSSDEIRIGYFGHLTPKWFDWEALATIARSRPAYRFELIGHGAPPVLDLPDNIELFGPKKSPEICQIASRWRVAIIPFKMGQLADGVDPIKIYEYFGLGLPVVSFRMPQIEEYPYTRTVDSRLAFATALDEAVDNQPDPKVLTEFLDANTWKHRARQFLDLTDEILTNPSFEKTLASSWQDEADDS
jgi:FkbM family methyltransferase